jgi:hypothetical protein
MTFTVTTTATNYVNVIYSYSATEVTGNGVYIYGAQLEALPFATSYIPTAASSVTRASDILNVTRAGNIPNVEANGVISVLCDVDVFGNIGNNQWVWALYPSGTDNIGLVLSSNTGVCVSRIASVTDDESITLGAVPARTVYRIGQVASNAGHFVYKNGVQVGFKADTDSRITSTCNSSVSTIRIGSYNPTDVSTYALNGHISNFRVYDRALTAYEVSLA